MKNLVLIYLLFAVVITAHSQDTQRYMELINQANALYKSGDFLKSGHTFSDAFTALGDRGTENDRYNAACSYALASESDSAFVQLFRIARVGDYANYDHMVSDTDLDNLHDDARWGELKTLVSENKEKEEANYNRPLMEELDAIYEEDQSYRMQIEGVEEKYGRESDEMKAHWALISETDSINLIKVTKILDENGWLGADVVGEKGNTTLFLVIQHADLATQKKYLPMMREAVKIGNARGSAFALLEDRVALRSGDKQIYGSQIGRNPDTGLYYLSPMIDPDNVDERRESVGLGPIADYVGRWDITWDVEKYKAQLPEIEALEKKGF